MASVNDIAADLADIRFMLNFLNSCGEISFSAAVLAKAEGISSPHNV